MCRGLFLDLDGTVADSLGVLRQTYQEFLTRHLRQGSAAEFARLNGPTLPEIVLYLKEAHHLPGGQEALLLEYRNLISDRHQEAPPAAGAAALMSRAKEHGYVVCIVTSASTDLLDAWLSRHGLEASVDVKVTGDDIGAAKPAPDPYLRALKLTGCAAQDSLAIEDSLNGVLAATRAGLPTWRLCSSGPLEAGPETGKLATLVEAEALLRR